jgi:hypothetical protein
MSELNQYLATDMQLAWEEWHRDCGVEDDEIPGVNASFSRGYRSGVASTRWMLQSALPHLARAEQTPEVERLIQRIKAALE